MQSQSITVVSIPKFLERSIKDSSITVSFISIKMIAINFRKDMILNNSPVSFSLDQ